MSTPLTTHLSGTAPRNDEFSTTQPHAESIAAADMSSATLEASQTRQSPANATTEPSVTRLSALPEALVTHLTACMEELDAVSRAVQAMLEDSNLTVNQRLDGLEAALADGFGLGALRSMDDEVDEMGRLRGLLRAFNVGPLATMMSIEAGPPSATGNAPGSWEASHGLEDAAQVGRDDAGSGHADSASSEDEDEDEDDEEAEYNDFMHGRIASDLRRRWVE